MDSRLMGTTQQERLLTAEAESDRSPLDDPSQLAALYDTVHSLVGRVAILESRLATVECHATTEAPASPTSPRRPRIRPCNCRVHLHRP